MPMRATGARPHRTCPHGSRERWTSSAWRNSAHLPYAAGLRPTSRQRQHSLPHPTALSRAQLDSPLRPTREFPYDTRPPSQAGAPTRRASPPCTCGPHLPSLGPREGQSPRPQILPGVNAYPQRLRHPARLPVGARCRCGLPVELAAWRHLLPELALAPSLGQLDGLPEDRRGGYRAVPVQARAESPGTRRRRQDSGLDARRISRSTGMTYLCHPALRRLSVDAGGHSPSRLARSQRPRSEGLNWPQLLPI